MAYAISQDVESELAMKCCSAVLMTEKEVARKEGCRQLCEDEHRSNTYDQMEIVRNAKGRERERWSDMLEERNRSGQDWDAMIQLEEEDQISFRAV